MTNRRITIVASQALGYGRCGGPGAATSYLALGLAGAGHRVEILHVGEPSPAEVDPGWAERYEHARVTVRVLPRSERPSEPRVLSRPCDVARALSAEPPDVVIAEDFAAPAYAVLQLRSLGLGFEDTLLVAFCHGTWRLAKLGRRVEIQPETLMRDRLEQACVELADVAVSPSAWLLEFMAGQGWRLPEATAVIPHVTEAVATGEAPPRSLRSVDGARLERIAYFGRLEERKGLVPFLAGVNAVRPGLLQGLELEFVGRPTKGWPTKRVEASLAPPVRGALRRVAFETELDQRGALTHLCRPGTLAVLPSVAENSPVAVYECLEWGVPFIASDVGGIGELVAEDERPRTLFQPTAAGVADALERALAADDALRAPRPAFDAQESVARWSDVVGAAPRRRESPPAGGSVEAIVVRRRSPEAPSRCLDALARQTHTEVEVVVAATREAGLHRGSSPWVVFLDEEDVPEPGLVETLLRAQAASGADVVGCGLDLGDREHLFIGEPAGMGVLANAYGTVALLRRSLLEDVLPARSTAGDPDWPLAARLSARGARIVSVPLPLVRRTARPGALDREPRDALLVVLELERTLPDNVSGLVRLAAGLAAHARADPAPPQAPFARRALRRLAKSVR